MKTIILILLILCGILSSAYVKKEETCKTAFKIECTQKGNEIMGVISRDGADIEDTYTGDVGFGGIDLVEKLKILDGDFVYQKMGRTFGAGGAKITLEKQYKESCEEAGGEVWGVGYYSKADELATEGRFYSSYVCLTPLKP